MKHVLPSILMLSLGGAALAQESASYDLKEHVLNAGGRPETGTVISSASFEVSLDALGEGLLGRGLSSPSFRLDGGFGSAYPPPGEVNGLRLADEQTLQWDPERSVGGYNLYRGLLSTLPGLGFGACLQQDLSDENATDADTPPSGDGFFYLVTATNRLDEEGTKGSRSDGTERGGTTCP